jgi:putative ABC transport system ATP-binding protein
MIQLESVNKTYAGNVPALIDVNLTINRGENVIITGKSGSGKSTLLNILAGIDKADNGTILINNGQLHKMNENELAAWRGKNIGIIFQFYMLLPTLTAINNILFAMEIANKIPKKKRKQKALSLLDEVGLLHKKNKFPGELSGGERQRVAIARAMANEPVLILADEATGNLDSKTASQIHLLFENLNLKGTTIVRVTHEDISQLRYSSLFRVSDGRIVNSNKGIV